MKIHELTLGEKIADRMAEIGISSTDLCKKAGIKATTLSEIITGARKNPTSKVLIALSKGLGVSVDYLLGLSKEPSVDANMREKAVSTGVPSDVLSILEGSFNDDEYSDLYSTIKEFLTSPYIGVFFSSLSQYSSTINDNGEKIYFLYSSDDILYENEDDLDGKVHLEFGSGSPKSSIISKKYRIKIARLELLDIIDEIIRMSKSQYILNKEFLTKIKNSKHFFDGIPKSIEESRLNKDVMYEMYDKAVFSSDEKIEKLEREIGRYERFSKTFYDELEKKSKR